MANTSIEIADKITEIEEQEKRMQLVLGRMENPRMITQLTDKLNELEKEKSKLREIAEEGISLDKIVSPPTTSTDSVVSTSVNSTTNKEDSSSPVSISVNGVDVTPEHSSGTTQTEVNIDKDSETTLPTKFSSTNEVKWSEEQKTEKELLSRVIDVVPTPVKEIKKEDIEKVKDLDDRMELVKSSLSSSSSSSSVDVEEIRSKLDSLRSGKLTEKSDLVSQLKESKESSSKDVEEIRGKLDSLRSGKLTEKSDFISQLKESKSKEIKSDEDE
jgi:hypothetical protein